MAPRDIKMMASLVINSIRSALNALESSEEDIDSDEGEGMKCWLKNLELFVLCARKLGNDAQLRFDDGQVCTLASLLQRIHDVLTYKWDAHTIDDSDDSDDAHTIVDFMKEIGGWYNTLLVSLPQPTSFDELNEIIDSLLDNLHFISSSLQQIEALIEKITFLRNFIRFATLRSIETPQLLAHIQAVAVDAAHTSFMYIFREYDEEYDEEGEYKVKANIPVLLQMIKMVDPQVDETYTQALTSSKLSTHLLSPIIMKDFIDSLVWNLWERLHRDTPIVNSTNSELRLVYEFLRLLSNVLEEQPNKFDKRIGELTRVVICDAGILIFSLYQRDMEIDVPDSGLLQRINRITQIVKGKDFSIPDLLQRIGRVTQMVKGKDFSIPDLLQIGQGLSDINMMVSLVLYSIRYALNDLERPKYIPSNKRKRMKWKLKNLELFVLCARKLGNDAQLRFDDGKVTTLESLFQRIHDAFPRNPPPYDSEILKKFEGTIANLKEEIDGWYNTLLVSLPQSTSFDEVTHTIDSVLEHLHLIFKFLYHRRSKQPIEAMIEKITFLRNFIRFATLCSVKSPQLLAHIHAVAVDAAHTSFMYTFQQNAVELNIPVMLQMIKIVDPQVDETYTQALTSSKLSTHLLSLIPDKVPDPSVIMKDFIESLLWNLWERLHTDTAIVISTNTELKLVYEGLRLLRSMLEEQPNKFDKRFGEVTRVVICDAGILIFSLYHRDVEIVVSTSSLLQRINRIRQIVNGKDFSIPDLLQKIFQVGGNDLPKTNELGFIDFVLENLLGMTSSKECYDFQSQFQMIHEELYSLRYSLGEIEGVRNEQKDLEALWNDGIKVAYRVEFLIDDLVLGDFQGSSSTSFDSTLEDIIREVKSINSRIRPDPDIKLKKVIMARSPVLFQNRAPVADDIVGFHHDITSIIDRLKRGSELKMVAIVGMPGIGKTTLATKVFNHPFVPLRFQVRSSCCVSQLFHRKNVLLELLNHVDPNTNVGMSEQDLSEKLRKDLKGKRYLIFLDDVWGIEAWDSLKESFPDDFKGSRILVTSRYLDVVPHAMLDGEPLSPRQLTDDQSWELLQKKLPPGNEWSPALDEIGRQIAANCKGLPLTVVIVAGLLANTEPEGWKMFLESIRSVSGANHCMGTLELSYKHLPGHLKQCFLYFGLFPEDHEASVKTLIRLWIAEGFVRNNDNSESKSLEEVGRDYMMDLVGRSLVMVSKERSRGGVKACRIHDLLHDFCRTKGKEENFLQVLEGGYDEFISLKEPGYMRRLCVHSEQNHFKNLRVFCPRLHSLLFFTHDLDEDEEEEDEDENEDDDDYDGDDDDEDDDNDEDENEDDISFIIRRYSRLRVLDISQYLLSLSFGIPREIGRILQLKYLSATGYIGNILSSIGSFANLETFILHSYSHRVSMPDTFWKLQKLRHVDLRNCFHLAFENLEKFPELCELQSCSNVVIRSGESIERLVRKFPNIRKLGLYWEDSIEIEILIPDTLRQLESLVLTSQLTSRLGLLDDLPGNLRKLSLRKFLLHDVSKIGKLPNLEVLKFDEVDFHENTWDVVEGEFSTLRFLKLTGSEIIRWTASDDQFPCLEKLVLRDCYQLEEIPCCFESIDTLEMVEVEECSDTLKNFFKRIRDELGNSFLKLQISEFEMSWEIHF